MPAASRAGLLELKSYDDGYEPDRAIVATKTLIEIDQVFALIGAVGTPTSKAAQPIATGAGVPFIGPYTGAEFLRDPSLRNVVNLRASYFQETETWVEHLTRGSGRHPPGDPLPGRLLRPRRL